MTTATTTLRLHIGQALPHGNEQQSESIIALWQQLQRFFAKRSFTAINELNGRSADYQLDLDASELLALMTTARQQFRSFSGYLKAHIADPLHPIDASLQITLTGAGELTEAQGYQVASVFLQQLVLAASIILPGSIQTLDARFVGPGAHRYEAQHFDSRILRGARLAAAANKWPALQQPDLETVWAWLDSCGTSQCHTAISAINKVLFTLLKVAEQRHEYSARTVLLIVYQLEMLLDSRNSSSAPLRRRIGMVLGRIPEAADCLVELLAIRNSLFMADQPVHRPPLISHTNAAALRELIGQHNSAVESGLALVLALLHDLISHKAQAYEFSEAVTRVGSAAA